MKRNLSFMLLGLFALMNYGCAITMPSMITANDIGNKVGKSSATCYFYTLCFDQDASIQSAAKNGGISNIATVDIKTKNILGIIITYETIVTGQ